MKELRLGGNETSKEREHMAYGLGTFTRTAMK